MKARKTRDMRGYKVKQKGSSTWHQVTADSPVDATETHASGLIHTVGRHLFEVEGHGMYAVNVSMIYEAERVRV